MGKAASSDIYRQLVESAGDVIAAIDADGIVTFVNSRAESYVDLTASETVGRQVGEFVHPDDLEAFLESVREGFAGRPIKDFEFRTAYADGSVGYWVANGWRTELNGKPAMMAICRDRTDTEDLKRKLIAKNEALAALSEVAVALSSSIDLDLGCKMTLDKLLPALGFNVGAILIEDGTGRLRFTACSPPTLRELAADDTANGTLVSQQCLDRGEPIFIPDLYADDIEERVQKRARQLGVGATLMVPLKCGGATKAVLSLSFPTPTQLDPELMDLVLLTAGILGPAIENASLHSDLTDRVDRLLMLEKLAKSINAERNVGSVLQACMGEIRHLVPYDIAVVVLFREGGEADIYPFSETGTMQPMYGYDLSDEQMATLAGYHSPVALNDIQAISHYHTRPDTFQQSTGSAGMVPLLSKGKTSGLLKVWSKEQERYGSREIGILQAVAEHLAIAASNARMFEREQQRSLELDALAKESQHRIKNNLQMVSGLLNVPCPDGESCERTLNRCLRQVRAISAVHDMIGASGVRAGVHLKECVEKIASNALQATGRADSIGLAITGEDCSITADAATAVGVIVNELVMNAVEHGFAGEEQGQIEIRLSHAGKRCCIEVCDNGVGLPEGFRMPDSSTAAGLGLVTSLVEHGLGGQLNIDRRERGTAVRISVRGA